MHTEDIIKITRVIVKAINCLQACSHFYSKRQKDDVKRDMVRNSKLFTKATIKILINNLHKQQLKL